MDFLGSGTFIIAEIGNNHNGSVDAAKHLVDAAVNIGANCVKFQMRSMNDLYREKSLNGHDDDLGSEYIIDLLSKYNFSKEQHIELFNYCKDVGILYMCTPWDFVSVDILAELDVQLYKVASADIINIPLIEKIASTSKPLFLSTGMAEEVEIEQAAEKLLSLKADFALLHCNSTYPAPFEDIHLKRMLHLKNFTKFFGYSGHERGIAVSIAAVAMGAKIIERHITTSRELEGPDHAASLEVQEFKSLVDGIRQVEKSFGNDKEKHVSQGERINRQNLAKSLVASQFIEKGTIITKELVEIKSPGRGLAPYKLNQLIGRKIERNLEKDDFFYPSDLQRNFSGKTFYKFNRPWGIPVRYHDFNKFVAISNPDFLEFHLSYDDMELNMNDYLKGKYDLGFVVHAPELFKDSTLMNLMALDPHERQKSIDETQRVVDITREMKRYFSTERPLIVANVGGFSMDSPIELSKHAFHKEALGKSLNCLDLNGVELIPQTMAPFPWHFGGQRHQNFFLLPEQICSLCEEFSLRVCFDVSHSFLTCKHYNYDFKRFIKKISKYVAYLHLGDAKGVNGEGLQIGEGEMDISGLCYDLENYLPKIPFIPEIWQGHVDHGSGFWYALSQLEDQI